MLPPGRKLLVVQSENGFGIAMPSATRRPDARLAWKPLQRTCQTRFARTVGRCKWTPIGPNRADAGNAPRSAFANRGEPGANPKTRWPRGRAGPSFPQKVAGLYTKPSKKVHRIRGRALPEISESAGKPSVVPVLYSTERPAVDRSGEIFVIGPVCGRQCVSSPVWHVRPCDLAGSSHAP